MLYWFYSKQRSFITEDKTIKTYRDVYDSKFIDTIINLFPETEPWFDTKITLDNPAIKVEELIKLMHVTLAYETDMPYDFSIYDEKTHTLVLNANVSEHRRRFEIARQIGFLIQTKHNYSNIT